MNAHNPTNQANPAVSQNTGTADIESVHRDVALSNQYRIELIKLLLTITAALFAFSVTFRPSLYRVESGGLMWLGWLFLGLSMIGGLFHMMGWDHYYKSYRDYDWYYRNDPQHKDEGKKARKNINCWRRLAMFFQFGGFILGVAFIGGFAARNIDNTQKPEPCKDSIVQIQPVFPPKSPTISNQSSPEPSITHPDVLPDGVTK